MAVGKKPKTGAKSPSGNLSKAAKKAKRGISDAAKKAVGKRPLNERIQQELCRRLGSATRGCFLSIRSHFAHFGKSGRVVSNNRLHSSFTPLEDSCDGRTLGDCLSIAHGSPIQLAESKWLPRTWG